MHTEITWILVVVIVLHALPWVGGFAEVQIERPVCIGVGVADGSALGDCIARRRAGGEVVGQRRVVAVLVAGIRRRLNDAAAGKVQSVEAVLGRPGSCAGRCSGADGCGRLSRGRSGCGCRRIGGLPRYLRDDGREGGLSDCHCLNDGCDLGGRDRGRCRCVLCDGRRRAGGYTDGGCCRWGGEVEAAAC